MNRFTLGETRRPAFPHVVHGRRGSRHPVPDKGARRRRLNGINSELSPGLSERDRSVVFVPPPHCLVRDWISGVLVDLDLRHGLKQGTARLVIWAQDRRTMSR